MFLKGIFKRKTGINGTISFAIGKKGKAMEKKEFFAFISTVDIFKNGDETEIILRSRADHSPKLASRRGYQARPNGFGLMEV